MFEVRLPFPISVNNAFPQTREGRRFPSARYKAWKREAQHRLMVQMAHVRGKARLRHTGPAAIRIELMPPDRKARDADNLIKCCQDVLVEMRLIEDDSRIVDTRACWVWQTEPGARVLIGTPAEMAALPPPETFDPKIVGPLTKAQRRAFVQLRRKPLYFTPRKSQHVSPSIKRLVEAGLAEFLPGLFDGSPQGVEIMDQSRRETV